MVFILASIVLMTVDHRYGYLESLRSTLSVIVYPLQYMVNIPVRITRWTSEALVSRASLLEQNERLRQERLLLSSRLQRFEVLEMENQRMRRLLESSIRLADRVIIAELLAVDLQPFRHTVLIDKGRREGAFAGQPIVDADGIMGQIVHVGPFSSTVLLITDPTHSIPVQINRNGLRSIAAGTGQSHSLQLEYLPNNADIRKGDLIVSSGLGSRFPAGYPVGVVTDIRLDPAEPFARVMVAPSARMEQSREVLMLWPSDNKDHATDQDGFAVNP
jgi:rod shape-determining protein MreC